MTTTLPIEVRNLRKRFRRYRADRPATLQESVLRGWRGLNDADYFWALDDVSFMVESGEMLGILGPNGAGKSTLLRLLGGVGQADEGSVSLHGRIGALLELGAGFHGDLTGRENVYVNGVVAGLTRREVARRFDSIVAFAELAEFIDNPLRTYSTGMHMRLAFSVAVHIDPEILLIDEVLAVGDIAFQRKCLNRITEFKEAGCAIALVSHDAAMVQRLCDKVLWLRQGKIAAYGPPDVVVGQYVADMTAETRRRTPSAEPAVYTETGAELRLNETRFGSLEMEIVSVRLLNQAGQPVTLLDSGWPLQVEIGYSAPRPIPSPVFGVTISRADETTCYDTSTANAGESLPTLHGRGRVRLFLERLDLNAGDYFIDVGVYQQDWDYAYDYHWHAYPLTVEAAPVEKGILRPPRRWEFEPDSA